MNGSLNFSDARRAFPTIADVLGTLAATMNNVFTQ